MSVVQAMLWDQDGTIIDTEKNLDLLNAQLLAEYDVIYDKSKKAQWTGKSDLEGLKLLAASFAIDVAPEELQRKRKPMQEQWYAHDATYVPEFETFFERLYTTFSPAIALASSCDLGYFSLLDRKLRLTERFNSNIFLAKEVQKKFPAGKFHGKPAPDLFIYAAQQLGVPMTRTAIVEDSPLGIVAGLRSGARVIALVRTLPYVQLRSAVENTLERSVAEGQEVLFIPDYSELSFKDVKQYLS